MFREPTDATVRTVFENAIAMIESLPMHSVGRTDLRIELGWDLSAEEMAAAFKMHLWSAKKLVAAREKEAFSPIKKYFEALVRFVSVITLSLLYLNESRIDQDREIENATISY
jgi:hypothetical protein